MNLKTNTAVVAADGSEVGRVDRVVIDPYSKDITYLVVRKGGLFTKDKVLPISYVSARDDVVVLQPEAGDLNDLPDFEETYYMPAGRSGGAGAASESLDPTSLYYYPPVGTQAFYGASGNTAPLRFDLATETRTNIPEDNVALKPGARVLTRDGKHIGDVAEVVADAGGTRVSHVVISQGVLFTTRKVIPAAWILDVAEDAIHLSVGDEVLGRLRDHA